MIIYKYPLSDVAGPLMIAMHRGARLLDAQHQEGVGPVLWALVDERQRVTERHLRIYWTGQPIDTLVGEYVATYQSRRGLVCHLFDMGESP